MKNKMNEWLDKPWTNRTYCKAAGISLVVSLLYVGTYLAAFYGVFDEVLDKAKRLVKKFRR